MRKEFISSAILLLGLASAPLSAMPIAPLNDAPSGVTFVAMGCGPGFTRGPYGRCHAMGYGARPVYVAPVRPVYGVARPYARRCWWRAGVRVCN